MSYVEALALALLQAITEFLPVSSSGHLVLAQRWLGGSAEIDILYDVVLHVATTVAILVYFRRDVLSLFRGLAGIRGTAGSVFDGQEARALWYIVLANLPTVVVGLLIQRFLVSIVTRPDVVGAMLIVTGCLLWCGRGRMPQRRMDQMRPLDALTVGLLQGIAVLPGISRSGSTITGGIIIGIERDLAVRFSLLMSVPAVLGAAVLQLSEATMIPVSLLGPYAAGVVMAGLAGYLAIGVILRLVRGRRFYLFAYYLWPLGILAIVWHHWS